MAVPLIVALTDCDANGGSGAAVPLPPVPLLHNDGNYVISLSQFTRWLGTQAEALGVEIFPGTPAAEVLYDDANRVVGVATR
jgi:electron-transferring-flavoprotein dehydrogenase